MNIRRIASRVADIRSIKLDGPFSLSPVPFEYEEEVTLPFALEGEIVNLLAEKYAEDIEEFLTGFFTIPVGFNVVDIQYSKGQHSTFEDPGDGPSVEFDIVIKTLGEFGLTDRDSLMLSRAGLDEILIDRISEEILDKAGASGYEMVDPDE